MGRILPLALRSGLVLLLWIGAQLTGIEGIAFENCNDGFTPVGNCKTIEKDGALGSESANSILLDKGFVNFGAKSGCPYDVNSCQDGFNFYGWVKFYSYPATCESRGVIVTTNQFNIHILGNGHLAAYVWMANDTEWYAETIQPVLLNIYYPIVLQFTYNKTSSKGSLRLVMQSQLSAMQNCSRPRTYTPPAGTKFIFGSDGVSSTTYANIQLDRVNLDGPVKSMNQLIGSLIDVNARQSNCNGKSYSTMTRDYTCFWLEDTSMNWTASYDACNKTTYNAGYPYGRLARFPTDNVTVWETVTKRLAQAGNGSNGYMAWIGGGQSGNWLNMKMAPVGSVSYPSSVVSNVTVPGCMVLNTKTNPWQWTQADCSSTTVVKKRLCEMSWDCMLTNPCQNLGGCNPVTDGATCTCFNGTSGKYCEQGTIMPTCVNQCPCRPPPILTCEDQTTTTSTTSTTRAATTPIPQNNDPVAAAAPVIIEEQDTKTCNTRLRTICENQTDVIKRTKVFLVEADSEAECTFDKQAKDQFDTFWKKHYAKKQKKRPDPHGHGGEITPDSQKTFKKMMQMRLNEKLIAVYAELIRHKNLQLPDDLRSKINIVNNQCSLVKMSACYYRIQLEHCDAQATKNWDKFFDHIQQQHMKAMKAADAYDKKHGHNSHEVSHSSSGSSSSGQSNDAFDVASQHQQDWNKEFNKNSNIASSVNIASQHAQTGSKEFTRNSNGASSSFNTITNGNMVNMGSQKRFDSKETLNKAAQAGSNMAQNAAESWSSSSSSSHTMDSSNSKNQAKQKGHHAKNKQHKQKGKAKQRKHKEKHSNGH